MDQVFVYGLAAIIAIIALAVVAFVLYAVWCVKRMDRERAKARENRMTTPTSTWSTEEAKDGDLDEAWIFTLADYKDDDGRFVFTNCHGFMAKVRRIDASANFEICDRDGKLIVTVSTQEELTAFLQAVQVTVA